VYLWPEHAPTKPASFTLFLGYQDAPDPLIEKLSPDQKLVYTTVRPTTRSAGPNVLYIDPHWPLEDGVCRIEGYPVPIFPSSAVTQAAIYWAVMAEATGT
jgi:hypothetical protein